MSPGNTSAGGTPKRRLLTPSDTLGMIPLSPRLLSLDAKRATKKGKYIKKERARNETSTTDATTIAMTNTTTDTSKGPHQPPTTHMKPHTTFNSISPPPPIP